MMVKRGRAKQMNDDDDGRMPCKAHAASPRPFRHSHGAGGMSLVAGPSRAN